jgi:hypothetical protein
VIHVELHVNNEWVWSGVMATAPLISDTISVFDQTKKDSTRYLVTRREFLVEHNTEIHNILVHGVVLPRD